MATSLIGPFCTREGVLRRAGAAAAAADEGDLHRAVLLGMDGGDHRAGERAGGEREAGVFEEVRREGEDFSDMDVFLDVFRQGFARVCATVDARSGLLFTMPCE